LIEVILIIEAGDFDDAV